MDAFRPVFQQMARRRWDQEPPRNPCQGPGCRDLARVKFCSPRCKTRAYRARDRDRDREQG